LKVSSLFLLAAFLVFATCSKQHKAIAVASSADFNKGTSFLDRQNDSAYYYFNKVATSSKDSLQIAVAYNYMARLQSNGGDYYGSQETLLESLNYLHENKDRDQYCLSSDLDALGSTSLNLKNYDAAITYYDRAIALMKNEKYRDIELNNKGFAYQKKGQYSQAIAIYESILSSSKKSKKELARVITNLAMARWLQDSSYRAAPDLLMALQIRKAENDDWGLNSSYAHLSDFYLTSRPDSALIYSRSMYAIASRLQSPDDELEALQKLVVLSPATESKGYFIRFRHLNDSLQAARNAAKNQFALIRYEAEKNKTDNLRLQQENDQRKLQILRQRIILYSSIFGLLIVIGVLFWANKTRLRRYQLRTSRKIHDIVANGLYRLMTEIEHGDQIEKETLLDELEDLYERSRDISYDIPETPDLNYSQTIGALLKLYSGPSTMVLIQGNDQNLWDRIADHTKNELKRILQELMTNMQKHSDARNVLVQFEQEGDQLKTRYTDDGVGFASDQKHGNGLLNTENRIKSVGGRIIFDKNTPKGLKIEIYFPIG
jgi:signal transduction histidine kinase